jgi:hypothetical protein
LVAEDAADFDAFEGAACELAVGVWVGGGDDFREVEFLGVEFEEGDELVVVFDFVQVHPHSSAGVCGIGDEDAFAGSSVQFVDEPGVDRAKGKAAFVVCFLHLVAIAQQPEELG